MLLENLTDGFYHLSNADDSQPVLVYLYNNHDAQTRGFGFNIADGGGFLPLRDVRADSVIVPVRIVENAA